jgi:hypothetical protein
VALRTSEMEPIVAPLYVGPRIFFCISLEYLLFGLKAIAYESLYKHVGLLRHLYINMAIHPVPKIRIRGVIQLHPHTPLLCDA